MKIKTVWKKHKLKKFLKLKYGKKKGKSAYKFIMRNTYKKGENDE